MSHIYKLGGIKKFLLGYCRSMAGFFDTLRRQKSDSGKFNYLPCSEQLKNF